MLMMKQTKVLRRIVNELTEEDPSFETSALDVLFLAVLDAFFPLQLWMPSFGVSCNTLLLFRMLRTCNLYLYAYLYPFCLSITIL